jgi:predicted metal-dependent enzyme (double-stranded beta helix superfamily)
MEDTAKEPGVWPWPDSLDAVVAAPGSHRVVLENELTRVLEVTIAPGEREPEHTHRWSSVMVVHRPARIRYYTGDTLTFTSPKQPAPDARGPRVSWLDPEGPHSVENIDGHPYGAFRIELKQR